MERKTLDEIAKRCVTLANLSTCMRMHFGAVIFKNGIILSEGFNYPVLNACSKICIRDELNIHHGQRLELCYAVHAEQEAICSAARRGIPIDGADIMVVGLIPSVPKSKLGLRLSQLGCYSGEVLWKKGTQFYCSVCAKLIIGARLRRIYGITKDGLVWTTPEKATRFAMDAALGKKSYDAYEGK